MLYWTGDGIARRCRGDAPAGKPQGANMGLADAGDEERGGCGDEERGGCGDEERGWPVF